MAVQQVTPEFFPSTYSTEVSITFDSGEAIIRLCGDIDLAVAEQLNFVAQETIVRGLSARVDLSRVTFMDSTGVGLIAGLVRANRSPRPRVKVIAPSPLVREILTISGLLPELEVLGAVKT